MRSILISVSLLAFSAAAAAEDWQYLEQLSGEPQGGIVIRYPDIAEGRARILGEQLRHHGWSSLLVPLPRSVTAAPEPPGTIEPIEFIKSEYGQLNLVLLTLGDAWDKNLVLDATEDEEGNLQRPIQAVVLVDVPGAFSPTPELPTLDIMTRSVTVHGYEQRQQLARKERIRSNQSLRLRYSTRTLGNSETEDFLTRRIRSWLHQNAKGMEITELAP